MGLAARVRAHPRSHARAFWRRALRRDPRDRVAVELSHGEGVSHRWLGVRVVKLPDDLWAYQELVHDTRPELIVECGTAHGGSTLFFACLCDLLGRGSVLSVDLWLRGDVPQHPRIRYLQGSSTDREVFEQVRSAAEAAESVLVVLDSDHTREHVLGELRLYAPLVPVGGWVVVEDTNLNGRPNSPSFGPGPAEAVDAFLAEDARVVRDRSREPVGLSSNRGGWLRRVG